MQRLIIIAGLHGSGKTTLARALSKQLNIVCIHKDSIKESLYESLNFATLDDSKKLGIVSMQLLYRIADEQIRNGVDVMIESAFNFEEDYSIFEEWESSYKIQIYSIICHADSVLREKRFMERERHQAHHDTERAINDILSSSDTVYEKLPGKIIKVYTDKPVKELIEEILRELK